MKKHATALRAFTHADASIEKSDPLHLEAGQFADWESAGLVREATPAEIARAKGEPAEKAAKPRAARKAKPAKPVSAPIAPAAATLAPDPAALTA